MAAASAILCGWHAILLLGDWDKKELEMAVLVMVGDVAGGRKIEPAYEQMRQTNSHSTRWSV